MIQLTCTEEEKSELHYNLADMHKRIDYLKLGFGANPLFSRMCEIERLLGIDMTWQEKPVDTTGEFYLRMYDPDAQEYMRKKLTFLNGDMTPEESKHTKGMCPALKKEGFKEKF